MRQKQINLKAVVFILKIQIQLRVSVILGFCSVRNFLMPGKSECHSFGCLPVLESFVEFDLPFI